jgi:hypothetical protein
MKTQAHPNLMRSLRYGTALSLVVIALANPVFSAETSDTKAVVTEIEATGGALLPIAAGVPGYRFTALNAASKFDDSALATLTPLAAEIVSLDLARTQVTDEGLSSVASMSKLKELRLDNTATGDNGLEHVKELSNLEYLNLYGTKVTDEGVQKLAGLTRLKSLYLWQSAVTMDGVKKLHEKLPQASIHLGWDEEVRPVAVVAVAEVKEASVKSEQPPEAKAITAKLDPVIAGKAIIYPHVIAPIIAEKCVACHGDDKAKGKLRMHTFADLLSGGSEGDVNVIPGKASDSLMIQRILLPHDDDEHMPPEDEPQITPEELALLKWWIDGGASETVTVAEAEKSAEIEGLLAVSLAGGLPKVETVTVKPEKPKAAPPTDEEKQKIAEITLKLQAVNAVLMPLAMDTPQLRLSVINAANQFGDAELALMEPIAKHVVWLDLARSQVTDAAMDTVAKMSILERLHLENTKVTDEGIRKLAALPALEYLNLYGTKVTDDGIKSLESVPSLKKLFVWQTGVSRAGAKALEGKMAGLSVNVGLSEEEIAQLVTPPPPPEKPAPKTKDAAPAPEPAAAPKPEATPKPEAAPKAETKPADQKPKPAPKAD